jgi:hypothetical protein
LLNAGLDHPVAAGGKRAIVPAGVGVGVVTVVAGLNPRPDNAVAALRRFAIVATSIILIRIAIITFFKRNQRA